MGFSAAGMLHRRTAHHPTYHPNLPHRTCMAKAATCVSLQHKAALTAIRASAAGDMPPGGLCFYQPFFIGHYSRRHRRYQAGDARVHALARAAHMGGRAENGGRCERLMPLWRRAVRTWRRSTLLYV